MPCFIYLLYLACNGDRTCLICWPRHGQPSSSAQHLLGLGRFRRCQKKWKEFSIFFWYVRISKDFWNLMNSFNRHNCLEYMWENFWNSRIRHAPFCSLSMTSSKRVTQIWEPPVHLHKHDVLKRRGEWEIAHHLKSSPKTSPPRGKLQLNSYFNSLLEGSSLVQIHRISCETTHNINSMQILQHSAVHNLR